MLIDLPLSETRNPVRLKTQPSGKTENWRPVSARAMEIRATVRLIENPYLRQHAGGINCFFDSGKLSICGKLPTYFLKQQAQESLRTMEGVEQIENRITIAESEQSSRDPFLPNPHFSSITGDDPRGRGESPN